MRRSIHARLPRRRHLRGALCLATLWLAIGGTPCAPEVLDGADTAQGRSRRSRPPEVYVTPSLPWEGPLPEVRLDLSSVCRLPGEPVTSPVWADAERLVVATADPEGAGRHLRLCGVRSAEPLWSAVLPQAPAGQIAADAQRAYVAFPTGEVRAYELSTGAEAWRSQSPGGEATGLARAGEAVLVSHATGLAALDPRQGGVRFFAELGEAPLLPLAECAGRWILALPTGGLRALDPRDGRVLWRRALPGSPAAPACDGESRVVVGTSARELVSLTATRGRRKWAHKLGGVVGVPVVFYAEGVYAGGLDGQVYGLKADSGHRMWSVGVGERVRRAPARVRDLLAVAAAGETRLSLIHLPTGSPLLEAEAPPEAAGWVGSPAANGDLLAAAADRRASPDGLLLVFRVEETAAASASAR